VYKRGSQVKVENKNGWSLELARLKVKLTQAEITISKADIMKKENNYFFNLNYNSSVYVSRVLKIPSLVMR